MRLLKDLYQVAGCMYGVHENIYAIRTEEGIVLIDTGLHRETYYVIRRNLSYWGLDQQRIHKVLLTHCHYEHSGNCYRFEAEKADIYIHAAESEAIRKGSDRIAEYRFFGCEPYQPVQTCISVNDGVNMILRYYIRRGTPPDRLFTNYIWKIKQFCLPVIPYWQINYAGKVWWGGQVGQIMRSTNIWIALKGWRTWRPMLCCPGMGKYV